MRRSTSSRYLTGIDRLNVMISGMPTPTVWLSPRKLVTRICFDGLDIVVNLLEVVPLLPAEALPVTVTVYLVFQDSALAGVQVRLSLSRVPLTSSTWGPVTLTVVFSGSSFVYFTGATGLTPVASA